MWAPSRLAFRHSFHFFVFVFQEQLIVHMMTPDERSDPKNAEIASRVLYWFERDQGDDRVHDQAPFIKMDMEGFQG